MAPRGATASGDPGATAMEAADAGSDPAIGILAESDSGPAPDVSASDVAASAPPNADASHVDAQPFDASFVTGVDGAIAALGGICAGTDGGSPGAVACGCTRRPGAGNASQCPAGVGEFVSTDIGPEGGTIAIAGRQGPESGVNASLTFPPAALAQPTTIVLTETAIPPPSDFIDWSPVYEVEPLGLDLGAATAVQFPWSNLGGFVPPLSIWFSSDGSCFARLPDSYTNAGFEMGSTRKLGYFLVGAPRSSSTATCP
jgi:hypothetical protein